MNEIVFKRKKRIVIKSKSKFIIFLTVIMLIISTAAAFIYNNSYAESTAREYIVENGDSIWSIAVKYKQSDIDVRDYVYRIKLLNSKADTIIYPGDTILLPM